MNLYRSGIRFCPMGILASLQLRAPDRFDREAHLPLFRKRDSSPVLPQDVSIMLKAGAAAFGIPPRLVEIHSLRSGGASAAHQQGVAWKSLKDHWRWRTDSVPDMRYVRRAHENNKELAAAMVGARGALARPVHRAAQLARHVRFVGDARAGDMMRCRGSGIPDQCLKCLHPPIGSSKPRGWVPCPICEAPHCLDCGPCMASWEDTSRRAGSSRDSWWQSHPSWRGGRWWELQS